MQRLSKAFVVAVCLLAIPLAASSAYANDVMYGKFTLSQATEWKGATLPAGEYTFRMARTQSDANMLMIRGENKALDMWVFSQSSCETCKNGALKVEVQGENRVVTSLELPGYHMDFKVRRSKAERERELAKTPSQSEQIAVQVGSN